jgi:hypothetical protein
MKHFAKFGIAILVSFWVIQCALKGICVTLLQRSEEPLARMYTGNIKANLVVIGNSRALRLFDDSTLERELALKPANLSVQGASTVMSLAILADYLERQPKPDIIIHEITDLIYANRAVHTLKMYSPHSDRLYALLYAEDKRAALSGVVFKTLNYNNASFRGIASFLPWGKRSHLLTGEMLASEVDASDASPTEYPSLEQNLQALIAIRKLCERHGVRYLPVVAPIHSSRCGLIVNFNEWVLQAQGVLGPGHPLADYSRHSVFKDRALFYDPTHINRKGVEIFLKIIMDDGYLGK